MKAVIIGFIVSIFIVGCGGGGSSGSTVNNSDNLENQYGFFGGDTKFQKYNIVRSWSFFQGNNVLSARYREDGSGKHNGHNIDYGVNKNGTEIIYDMGAVIKYLGTRKNYYEVTHANGSKEIFDCYDVVIDDSGTTYENIILCPNSTR